MEVVALEKSYNDFLVNQDRIYGQFLVNMTNSVCQDGLKPDPVITGQKGAYLLYLRPASIIRKLAAELSAIIKDVLPDTMIYPAENIHTSFSDYMLADGFVPSEDPNFVDITGKLSHVADIAAQELEHVVGFAGSTYSHGFVFNQTTLILPGLPNKEFLFAAEQVTRLATKAGIKLRMPWGAHISVARFGSIQDAAKAEEIAEICREANKERALSGMYAYEAICAGWFAARDGVFRLEKSAEISLL